MRIAPATYVAPTTMPSVGPARHVPVPAADGPVGGRSTARDVARAYGRDLLAVPGARFLGWAGSDDSRLFIDFTDEASASIAAGLLEPVIEGVEVLARVDGRTISSPAHESAGSASNRVRAIAAMRGVWDYRYATTTQWQNGRVTFTVVDDAISARLDPILRDQIAFGWIPDTGVPRYLQLSWETRLPTPA
jgi:hypothetical protein